MDTFHAIQFYVYAIKLNQDKDLPMQHLLVPFIYY